MATSTSVPEVRFGFFLFFACYMLLSFLLLAFLSARNPYSSHLDPICSLFFQVLKDEILIPIANDENTYYLGPMGDPDPTDFINLETQRILFK